MPLDNPFAGRDLASLSDDELEQGARYRRLTNVMAAFTDRGFVTDEALTDLVDRYRYPLAGTSRIVFLAEPGERVLKVAISAAGAVENQHELVGVPGIPIAPTTRATFTGVRDAIWMDWVDEIDPIRDIAECDCDRYDWIRKVDMMQVGRTQAGEVVAFDAGRAGAAHELHQQWRSPNRQ
ncbi:hypothetical protein P0W64_21210 [Tsukamurella sp. 8F]|uniref:hypothetical protein n=1 Tax=unclassified Tsukamurella TaxID=2633480 RepID=UPI0023B8AFB5|nr:MULTISPECIES: hypothetical protein [unclassified Tsukamurella]MDF0532277.1 hypothetical protein [Tsukamurella sp. 8J]MDF0589303.1 hypothetical protein [Tsukamurella sp. 8F]